MLAEFDNHCNFIGGVASFPGNEQLTDLDFVVRSSGGSAEGMAACLQLESGLHGVEILWQVEVRQFPVNNLMDLRVVGEDY